MADHRGYLHRIVELRLDRAIRARVDSSDIVQEAQLEAAQRIGDYLVRQPMPFHLWLRRTAEECLIAVRRRHAGAQCRAIEREVALPDNSSVLLARQLVAGGATPGHQLVERELINGVQQAMAELSDSDREIILLRNFEELSNQEAAEVLGIEPAAASKRYARAFLSLRKRLIEKQLLGSRP